MPAAPPDPHDRGGAASADDLLIRVARGDQEAFAALYDLTAARLYGLVLRVLRDPAQAEEVTQEVYLDIWRTAARFESSRGPAMGWLLTIAHRRAVDRVRSAQAETDRLTRYESARAVGAHDATAETATSRLEADEVHRALDSLSPVQREAITLAYLNGLTHTEVALRLGLPLGTAKTRIRDGLLRLRHTMGVTP